ncbi:hypothetical protein Xazr_09170 [Xanthomonas campestris pv. azadirachtae]|nr:hypothetical protein Xazr_09170 [Xanthomonas campestris pv. azadirachtae]
MASRGQRAMDGALTTEMYAWHTPIRSGGRARMAAVQCFFECSGPAACSFRLQGPKDQAGAMRESQRRRIADGAVARSKGIGAMLAQMTHACDVWPTR